MDYIEKLEEMKWPELSICQFSKIDLKLVVDVAKSSQTLIGIKWIALIIIVITYQLFTP